MIILVPNNKKYVVDFYRDLLYYFIDMKFDHAIYTIGYDITDTNSIDNIENDVSIKYLRVEEIKEINDVFPLDIIDEILEEYYERLEHIPDLDNREDVEQWVIATKVKDELERIRNIVIDELKEKLDNLKGCVFVEIIDGDVNKAKEILKEEFKDYIIVE
jgi:hypothetical protein